MATTLERASFANQPGGKINLKLDAPGVIAVGDVLTLTTPKAQVMTAQVLKFLPYYSLKAKVLTTTTSGILVLPKGTAVV